MHRFTRHNQRRPMTIIWSGMLLLLSLTLIGTAAAQSDGPRSNAPQVAAGTGFTYQGQLKQGGTPVNGTCDLAFRLFDAPGAGIQIGNAITQTLPITNGLFTTQLNASNEFGATAFNGAARWLEIRVSNACPSSGTFTTLTPRQALTPAPYALYASGNWGLQGNAGTSPTSNFFGTTDNQPLVFKTNNAEGMRLDSTGKLGIGTTSPSDKLTVMDGTIYSARTALVSEGFEGQTFPPAGWTTGGPSNWVRATNSAYQGSASAAITLTINFASAFLDFDYTLPAGGSIKFFWKANMRANSSYLLFCLDNDSCSRVSGYDQRITGDVNWTRVSVPLTPGAHSFRWVVESPLFGGQSEKAWLDGVQLSGPGGDIVADGNAIMGNASVDHLSAASGADFLGKVGIGTSHPQYALHVVGENLRVENPDYPRFSLHVANATADRGKWQNYASADYLVFSALNDAENSQTGWLTVYRGTGTVIDGVVFPNGNVGIGVDSPIDKLHVNGELRVANCVKNSGGTQIAGTCPSDARLKKNIEPFPTMLDKVTQLQPVYFDWRADEFPDYHFSPNTHSAGVLAQEVERILPELVSTDERGYKAVNYSEIPLLLLQALKELRVEKDAQLAAQRTEIGALQSQNADLQKQISVFDARLTALEQKAPVVSLDSAGSFLKGNLFSVLALLIGAAMFYRGRK